MTITTEQQKRSGIAHKLASFDWYLVLITLLAAIPRLYRPGMYNVWWDEVYVLRLSLRIVKFGEWTWLSNPPSWSTLPTHSPFNTYMFALPYLFSTDPRAARIWVALLGTLAVPVVYLAVRRYYGRLAATLAGVLLALSPNAVEWSRWVLNCNLAQVFIALWLLTGLIGYFEGKRWAQIAHWLMLSFAGQPHVGYGFVLTPLSLAFLVIGWQHFPAQRRLLVRTTLIAWVLLALSLVPWTIGLLQEGIGTNQHPVQVRSEHATIEWMRNAYSHLASSTDYWPEQRAAARDADWWPPLPSTDYVLWLKTGITFLGGLWLLGMVRRNRWLGVPGAAFTVLMFWPLIIFFLSPVPVLEYYLMPAMFGAYAVQGVILARIIETRPWTRWPVFALVAVFLVLQSWLIIGVFRWYDVGGNAERYRTSMDDMLHALDSWWQESDQVIMVTDTFESAFTPEEHIVWWEVLGAYDGPIEIAMPQGIPIYASGEVIAASWAGETIPKLFGAGTPQGTLINGEPIYRKVSIPPDYEIPLELEPETLTRFANGIEILGVHELAELQPGTTWPLMLVWSPDHKSDLTRYQFSLRVIANETTYGQFDGPSLHGPLWPPGERVVNLFEIPLAADMPLADVRIQVIVYSWPDMATVSAIDDGGNPVAPWLFLVPSAE